MRWSRRKKQKKEDVVVLSSDEEKQEMEEDEKQEMEEDERQDMEEDEKQKQEEEEEKEEEHSNMETYDAPEFCDFEKLREQSCFQAGQIWAAYDEDEGMPRFYALIKSVRQRDFMVQFAWLEVAEDNEYVSPNLPVSVGKFEVGETEETNRCSIFSHLVCSIAKRVTRCFKVSVFPAAGETWALFKNWRVEDVSLSPLNHEYEYVEIMSGYSEKGKKKISVRLLARVHGYDSVFCRPAKEEKLEVLPYQFCRFSHRIPSFELTGGEGSGVCKGWLELDPASLPSP